MSPLIIWQILVLELWAKMLVTNQIWGFFLEEVGDEIALFVYR